MTLNPQISPPGTPIAAGRTAEIYAWGAGRVLKLTRPGFPAVLAEQDWRQAEAAWKLGARAPRPIEQVEVDGRRGVVFQRVDGPTLSQSLRRALWRFDGCARLLAHLHAELHGLSAPGFPSLRGRARRGLQRAALLSRPRKEALLALLETLPEADTLCHGDFHLENILLTQAGPLIIDWEGSMHSAPTGDVALTCLWFHTALMARGGPGGWLLRQLGRRMNYVYLAEYQRLRGPLEHLDEWMAVHAACLMDEEHRPVYPALERLVRRVVG